MNIIKKVIFILLGIIILILGIGLFVDGNYEVEREITINLAKSDVFEYVKYLKNQDHFSVWAKMDPNMKKEFSGTDGTVGFVSGWESKNPDVGKGEQEIVAITPGERIDYELRFFEPFEATDDAYITFNEISENSTLISWGFDGKMTYPMNLMLLFMDMEEMIGGDLQTGLDNLKEILES